MIRFNVNLGKSSIPILKQLRGAMSGRLKGKVAAAVEVLTREWIGRIASKKHATAARLNARRTGFYARAINAVSAVPSPDGVQIVVQHPGFARALKDVPIRPKHGKYLTIPVNRAAYGRRARELENTFVAKAKKGGGLYIFRTDAGGRAVPMFRLVSSVLQKKDRSLLPSDRALGQAAAFAAREHIRSLTKGGA